MVTCFLKVFLSWGEKNAPKIVQSGTAYEVKGDGNGETHREGAETALRRRLSERVGKFPVARAALLCDRLRSLPARLGGGALVSTHSPGTGTPFPVEADDT